MPTDAILFFSPARGHLLLEEGGVSVAEPSRAADLDFLVGKSVVAIRHENQVVFETGTGPAPQLFARVEIGAECAERDGTLLPLSALVGRSVASASAVDSVLLLVFTDGATLRCEPDQRYEAWQVEGGDQERLIVCLPGGQLSVWDATPPIPYGELRERDPATAAAVDEVWEQFGLPRPADFPPPEKKGHLSRYRKNPS